MFDEILVCLDGSPLAEKILPLAQGIASGNCSTVILLRVLGSSEELSAEETFYETCQELFKKIFHAA